MSKYLLPLFVSLAACATTPMSRVEVAGRVHPVDARLRSAEALPGKASADVNLCVSASGQVIAADLAHSSQSAAFDRAVMTDVLSWEFPKDHGDWCTRLRVSYSAHEPV